MNSLFRGVNVAAITPHRKETGESDIAATLDLLDQLESAGVNGIAIGGTTGEFMHFTNEERIRLISFAAKRLKVPILAGITHSSFIGTVLLAEQAIDSGASALLIMPPYFFKYPQGEVLAFYRRLAERVDGACPMVLYNIPQFSSPVAYETAEILLGEGIYQGIKDSSGDFENFQKLLALHDRKPFRLLVGNDIVFTRARRTGAHGVVSGVASALPELMIGINDSIERNQPAKTDRLEQRLQEFIGWLGHFPVPVGVKEAVAVRGWKAGPHSIPFSAATEAKLEEFRVWLRDWLPVMLKEASEDAV
ncbi:MAG: dihydrodipicolinate synthase family protein [Bryobacteraceae bacterium]